MSYSGARTSRIWIYEFIIIIIIVIHLPIIILGDGRRDKDWNDDMTNMMTSAAAKSHRSRDKMTTDTPSADDLTDTCHIMCRRSKGATSRRTGKNVRTPLAELGSGVCLSSWNSIDILHDGARQRRDCRQTDDLDRQGRSYSNDCLWSRLGFLVYL